MRIYESDYYNMIEQLWEHANDSASYDVFAEGAEVILKEFGIELGGKQNES